MLSAADQALLEKRYRLAPQLSDYDRNEPYLCPYLTFTSRPNIRSSVFNTDAEGFRLSASPAGTIDSASWLEHRGGGLVIGGSWTFGVGASSDATTLPSVLASLSGSPQLNLGICTSNSLQCLIAAIPFLEHATTIVYCNNATTLLTSLQSLQLHELFGPIRFESMLGALRAAPLTTIVERALSADNDGRERLQVPRQSRVAGDREEAELDARLEAGLRRLARDLRVLRRAAPGHARMLVCHQPFADAELRDLTPEERELRDLNAERRGAGTGLRAFVLSRWESCGRRLAAECAAMGVEFLDMPAHRFAGWSFLDEWHMTDDGYRQAAEQVHDALL